MATSAVLPAPSTPMTSVTSMLAAIPADIMSGAGDISTPEPEWTPPADDAPEPEPADEPATDPDTPAEENTPASEPDGTGTSAAPDGAEALDEGTIKTKDDKGKYKYQLEENRYKTVYGNHQLVRQATDAIGEPLTLDGIKLRNEAYQAQERLYDHLTSGEPARQTDVLKFIIDEMKTAQADGETGVDPTIPFAQSVYTTLRDEAPEAYGALRTQASNDLLSEMYAAAAADNDLGLMGSAQRFSAKLAGVGPKPADMPDAQYAQLIRDSAAKLSIPFHTTQEMATLSRGEDPGEAMRRENAQLRAQLEGRTHVGAAEQYTQWDRANTQQVNKAVEDDAVLPALASVADSWKAFPDDYKRLVVDPLTREVSKIVRSDQALLQQVTSLRDRAKRATSEAVRQRIGSEIQTLFVNRAQLAAESTRGPILKFAADTLKGRSVETNERHTAAQQRTAPNGTGTPVKQSVMPTEIASFKGGVFDTGTAMKQALAALQAIRR